MRSISLRRCLARQGAVNNYNITYHNGTLTLSQRQLDITANNRTKTYGATVTFEGHQCRRWPVSEREYSN